MSQSDQTRPGSGHRDMTSISGVSWGIIMPEPSVGAKEAGEASSREDSSYMALAISFSCIDVG